MIMIGAPVAAAPVGVNPVTGLASGIVTGLATGLMGDSGLTTTGPQIFDTGGIMISPVGVNLGEIFAPYRTAPENGGYGLDIPSRLGFGDTVSRVSTDLAQASASGWGLVALLAALGFGGYYLLTKV